MVRSNKHKHTPADAAINDAGPLRPANALKCLARALGRAAARQRWLETTGKQTVDPQARVQAQASTSKLETKNDDGSSPRASRRRSSGC